MKENLPAQLEEIAPEQILKDEVQSVDNYQAFEIGTSDDFGQEVELTRQNTALMAFLDDRSNSSEPGNGTSLEQIRRELDESTATAPWWVRAWQGWQHWLRQVLQPGA